MSENFESRSDNSGIKVVPIQSPTEAEKSITLDSTLTELDNWRANKSTSSEAIPDELLKKIFSLRQHHSDTRLRAVFGLSGKQYENHYQRLYGHSPAKPKTEKTVKVDFCEAKPKSSRSIDDEAYEKYGPSLLPATNTIVVEYKRPDGYLLRIHTTDDSFPKLLREFAKMEFE
jgi:hypothetical protein